MLDPAPSTPIPLKKDFIILSAGSSFVVSDNIAVFKAYNRWGIGEILLSDAKPALRQMNELGMKTDQLSAPQPRGIGRSSSSRVNALLSFLGRSFSQNQELNNIVIYFIFFVLV
jgi:hypothetical protein